jgi:arsenate reductase (thioredoxin)
MALFTFGKRCTSHTDHDMNVLFICTHNRCRSIISEAITQQLSEGLIEARSAGSQPSGQVHPLTLTYLAKHGFDTDGLTSQSWDEFADFAPDVVITVCDTAAQETCPLYFTDTLVLHWGMADPSKISGDPNIVASAFGACIMQVKARARNLHDIAKLGLSGDAMHHALRNLIEP